MTNFADAFLGARDRAIDRTRLQQEDQNRSALAKLYGDHFTAAPEQQQVIGAEIARRGGDPYALESATAERQKRRQQELVTRARLIKYLPAEQQPVAWQRMQGDVASIAGVPELATMPWDAQTFMPVIDQLVGADGNDPKVLSPGAAMVDASGRVIYRNPATAAYSVQSYTDENGQTRYLQVPTKGEMPGRAYGVGEAPLGSVPQPAPTGGYASPSGPALPAGTFPEVGGIPQTPMVEEFSAQFPGFRFTSSHRDPARNAKADGESNSYHLTAEAIDGYPASPEQLAQIERYASMTGREVLKYPGGRIHVEPAPGARPTASPPLAVGAGMGGSGGGKGFGQTDRQRAEAAAFEERAKRTAQLQADIQMAPEVAAAEAAQTRATEQAKSDVERASTARTKAPQLQNVERGLTRIDSALAALESGFFADSGPVDQYALMFTQAGQELEAAVGAIQNDMLALTRVPGVGSQSDLEQKIANLKYPKLGNHPKVNRANLDQLRAFLKDLQDSINGAAPATQTGTQPGRIRYDAQGNRI